VEEFGGKKRELLALIFTKDLKMNLKGMRNTSKISTQLHLKILITLEIATLNRLLPINI
jgi:hypothetical protein